MNIPLKDRVPKRDEAFLDSYSPTDLVRKIESFIRLDRKRLSVASLPASVRARRIAQIAHQYQTRKGSGEPYTIHTDYVANFNCQARAEPFSEIEQATGHLHDVLEKTPLSVRDLVYLGVRKDIIQNAIILEMKNKPYFDGIENCAKRGVTRLIKRYDIEHNGSDRDVLTPMLGREALGRRNMFWNYRDPLAGALLETAEKYQEYRHMTMVDFVQSARCPEHLAGLDKLKAMNNFPFMRQPLTSHLAPPSPSYSR